jgi:lysophospholipase L1-like esterase
MKGSSNPGIKSVKRTKIIVFALIPLLAFIIIMEISINAINFFLRDRTSHLGFPFNVIMDNYKTYSVPQDYKVPWDFTTNKMRPGKWKYTSKFNDQLITEIDYTVNSMGFRGKEFDPYTKSGFRIICFGGSTTIGVESSLENTYPAQLEQMLNEKGIAAEVLNFGFGSKSLNFIINLFLNEAIHYKPDLITIYSNRNTALYDSNTSKSYYSDINIGKMNSTLTKMGYYLYENSMIYRASIKIKHRFKNYFFEGSKNNEIVTFNIQGSSIGFRKEYFFVTYPKAISNILLDAEKNNIKVALIKQPIHIDLPLQRQIQNYSIDQLWNMMTNKNNFVYQNHSGYTPFWIFSNALLNKQLDILTGKHNNFILVDPLDEFLEYGATSNELFYDYLHLTPKGNALIARIIADDISHLFEAYP